VSETDPRTKVATDLSAIENMTAALLTQAIHKANDREMPGGNATVALASVASPEAWENVYEAAEATGRDTSYVEDNDDIWEPPLQTLLFWSEQWREEHGYALDGRPTIASEANYLRWCINWAWENEPHFADFAADIKAARRRLEDVLYAGERVERGVPCMYDECKGARLTRKIDDHGNRTDWRCPKCKREWDDERYAQMVTAAHEATKFEDIAGETWCAVDYAARVTGRGTKTIRTWINRGEVATVCVVAGRRVQFVNLAEVRERHARAKKRRGRAA
jgi:hypothetical protein